jgi:hypothetical protein
VVITREGGYLAFLKNWNLFYMKKFLTLALFLALCACNQGQKVWIVLDFITEDGQSAQMAFDNPALPDITLKECEESLEEATQSLVTFAKNEPKLKNAKFVSSKCVESETDPIKPK